MILEFEGEVYRWEGRSDAEWYFVDVPEELSELLRELQPPRRGFGTVRVNGTVGGTSWRTSIVPAAAGTYSLPLKRVVRDAEGIVEGGPVAVRLETIDI